VVFQGLVLSVEEMLERAQADSGTQAATEVGVRHTASDSARACTALLTAGGSLDECWRFGILQTLDDYTSTLRRGGAPLGMQVFTDEPPLTGAAEVDAALAALACYLADRDGWDAPAWAWDFSRCLTTRWYPAVPEIFRDEADLDSPPAFRDRGIFITNRSLARA